MAETIAQSANDEKGDQERQRLGERIRDLRRVMEGAEAERDLAMYRAHQGGMPMEQIASVALLPVEDVRREITLLSREDDIDEWAEGPTWREFYPHNGWTAS